METVIKGQRVVYTITTNCNGFPVVVTNRVTNVNPNGTVTVTTHGGNTVTLTHYFTCPNKARTTMLQLWVV